MLPLFDEPSSTALQVWRLAPDGGCGIGSIWGTVRAPGWPGQHHCWNCELAVAESCQRFAEAVARGEYDAEGYTPKERRAQQKRKQAA